LHFFQNFQKPGGTIISPHTENNPMTPYKDYILVVDDTLKGFKDAFIDDRLKEISVSPSIFSLLQDSDCRDTVLEQIAFYNLNFFSEQEWDKVISKRALNVKELGKWS
jgi:hypothetical protein